MNQKELVTKLNQAATKIASASKRGPGNYVITSKNIGDILHSNFIRTHRMMQIEKIWEQINKTDTI